MPFYISLTQTNFANQTRSFGCGYSETVLKLTETSVLLLSKKHQWFVAWQKRSTLHCLRRNEPVNCQIINEITDWSYLFLVKCSFYHEKYCRKKRVVVFERAQRNQKQPSAFKHTCDDWLFLVVKTNRNKKLSHNLPRYSQISIVREFALETLFQKHTLSD